MTGVLIYLFVGPEGCPDPPERAPPFLYGSLFAFVGLQLLVIVVETIIFSISVKGRIYDHQGKRRWLPFWLLVRIVLFFLEIVVVIGCTVAVFGPAPYAAGAFQCPEYHDGPLVFAEAVVVSFLVLLAVYAVGFAIYLDPLGLCCAPSILQNMGAIDEAEELDEELRDYLSENKLGRLHRNHIGFGRAFRKVRGALCCLNAGGKRSRTTAMQELALALHTVFSDMGAKDKRERLVPSDLVAGMILVSRNQKRKRENCPHCSMQGGNGCSCLTEDFRNVSSLFMFACIIHTHTYFQLTLDHLPDGDKPHSYESELPQEFDFSNPVRENQAFYNLWIFMISYCISVSFRERVNCLRISFTTCTMLWACMAGHFMSLTTSAVVSVSSVRLPGKSMS